MFVANLPNDPIVEVHTTNNRGFTAEEITARCMKRLLHVSDSAPQVLRDQAQAFKSDMEKVILYYMKEAIKSDRTTVCNALNDAGQPELAKAIRRL